VEVSVPNGPIAFVVDADQDARERVSQLLRSVQIEVKTYASARDFLSADRTNRPGCLILEVRLPDMCGLDLQAELVTRDRILPTIFTTAYADVPMSVQAMKAGALDFFCKPVREETLLSAVRQALRKSLQDCSAAAALQELQARYDTLTSRERQVMGLVASGLMNKQIAGHLAVSEITVKVHRASIVRKTFVKSLAELVRFADAVAPRVRDVEEGTSVRDRASGQLKRRIDFPSANTKFAIAR
jgi:FixJ family two-component response regulator